MGIGSAGGRLLIGAVVCALMAVSACDRSAPTPAGPPADDPAATEKRLLDRITGTWHREKPIDYTRPVDVIQFVLSNSPDDVYRTHKLPPFAHIGVIYQANTWLSHLGLRTFAFFRLEGTTIELHKITGPYDRERVDWQIRDLTESRLTLRDSGGQETTYYRVDPEEWERERNLRRK